jgi:hypothetical protein
VNAINFSGHGTGFYAEIQVLKDVILSITQHGTASINRAKIKLSFDRLYRLICHLKNNKKVKQANTLCEYALKTEPTIRSTYKKSDLYSLIAIEEN